MRAFSGIQMMRGLAALSVAFGHALATPDTGINRDFGLASLKVLQVGVDVFFVISGFYMALVLDTRYMNPPSKAGASSFMSIARCEFIPLIG